MSANLQWWDPKDVQVRAVFATLINALVGGANLSHANLSGANLIGANFRRANLAWAYLLHAVLDEACFEGANLTGANLNGVLLREACLREANLNGTYFGNAYLRSAKGIAIAGPARSSGRLVYANRHNGVIKIRAGCQYLPVEEMRDCVIHTHGEDTTNTRHYMAIIDFLVFTLEMEDAQS